MCHTAGRKKKRWNYIGNLSMTKYYTKPYRVSSTPSANHLSIFIVYSRDWGFPIIINKIIVKTIINNIDTVYVKKTYYSKHYYVSVLKCWKEQKKIRVKFQSTEAFWQKLRKKIFRAT